VFGVTLDAASKGRGVLVQEVAPGGVAEAAGVKPGDRILSFGGKEATDSRGLRALLRGSKAGETVKVVVLRDGKELTLDAVYPKAPDSTK
jgi:serine protease Do